MRRNGMMKVLKRCVLMMCIMAFAPAPVLMAQSIAPSPAAAEAEVKTDQTDDSGTVYQLETIEVRSSVRRDELQSTSATVLDNPDIVNRMYVTPLDIALRSPGVNIVQYGENGVAPQLMMRGFTGAHGGGVAAALDGIPLQDSGHSDGYFDSGLIIPLEIESVEIIKGPASVYYGNYAQGGVLAFQSYKTGDFARLNMRYGSYNTVDSAGVLARQDNALSQVYAFQLYSSDGYRDHSDWKRQNFSGRWTYEFSEKFSASLNLRAYESDWNSAGYTPSTWSKTAAITNGAGDGNANGGDRTRYDGRLWANYFLTDQSQLTFYLFGTDLDNTRYSVGVTSEGLFRSGSEQSNHRRAMGTGLAYNFKGTWNARQANVTVGADYLHENESQDIWRLMEGRGRARGDQTTEYEFTLETISLFGEVDYQMLDPLKVRVGSRYDRFGGHMTTGDNNTAAGRGGANQYYDADTLDAFSPKAGLLYTPLDELDLFVNYGRGFSLPPMSGVSSSGNSFFVQSDPDLTKMDQYEVGFRSRPLSWLAFGSTYYYIDTDKDWTYNYEDEAYESAGKTKRTGIENVVEITFLEDWKLHFDYTYQTAKYKNYQTATAVMDGRRLAWIPRHVTNIELSCEPETGLGGRARYHWEADSQLDEDAPGNSHKGQDQGTLDLQLNYRFNQRYKVTLDVINLLDKDYYGYQYGKNDQGDPFFRSVQPPLTVYAGLDINW